MAENKKTNTKKTTSSTKDGMSIIEINGYKYIKRPNPYNPKEFVYYPSGKKDPAFEKLLKDTPGNDPFINQTSLERLKDPEYLNKLREEADNESWYAGEEAEKEKELAKQEEAKKIAKEKKAKELKKLREEADNDPVRQKWFADQKAKKIAEEKAKKAEKEKRAEHFKKLREEADEGLWYAGEEAEKEKAKKAEQEKVKKETPKNITYPTKKDGTATVVVNGYKYKRIPNPYNPKEFAYIPAPGKKDPAFEELKKGIQGNDPFINQTSFERLKDPEYLNKLREEADEGLWYTGEKEAAEQKALEESKAKQKELSKEDPVTTTEKKAEVKPATTEVKAETKAETKPATTETEVKTEDKVETTTDTTDASNTESATSEESTDTADPTVRDLDAKSYIGLIEKYNDNPSSLSNSEVKSLQKYINTNSPGSKLKVDGIIGEGTIDAISDYTTSDNFKQRLSSESSTTEINDAIAGLQTMGTELKAKNNALKAAYREEADARQELKTDVQKKTADAYYAAKVGVDTAKMLESYRQIKAGKEAQRELAGQRPQMPTLRESEDLASATQRAQARANQGLTDRALSAIRQQDIDDYSAQQAAIKSAAGSQSGVYASLMSKGGVDALKRNILLGQADQAAQAQNEMQAAQLSQARANELSTNQQLGLRYGYQPQLQEWQLSTVGAREAERAGRLNLARQQQVLPYTLGNLANQYYRRDEQTAPSLTGYNDPRVVQAAERTLKQEQARIANENNKLNEAQYKVDKTLAQNQLNTYKALAKPRVSNADKISAYIQGDEAYPSFMAANPFEETNNVGAPYKLEPIVPYK